MAVNFPFKYEEYILNTNKYIKFIQATEKTIRSRILKKNSLQNKKNKGTYKLRKNNASNEEIENFIKLQESICFIQLKYTIILLK